VIFATIFETTWRTVVAIGNNHSIFHDYRTNFFSFAVRQFAPFCGNAQIGFIVFIDFLQIQQLAILSA
jgi:hypothetical protein